VHRTACVDLPFFPLQLLLRRHPDWREHPAAVVDHDAPQGVVLWINDRARAARVLPGMRYAAALSLAPGLRAAEVPERDLHAAVERLTSRLRRFTPHVEPAEDEPGVFWLDARGLDRLYPSLKEWGARVRSALDGAGFRSTLVVGFGRFGSYALARAKRGLLVLGSARDEAAAARRVPLNRLAVDPSARDALGKLGVTTLGQLLDLPVGGLRKRFGPEVLKLHRRAAGELSEPMQPQRPEAPAMAKVLLDHPETSVDRLVIRIEKMLATVLAIAEQRGRAVAELQIGFRFERLGDHLEKIRPAAPTRDAERLLELVRLRLQALRRLPDGVEEIRVFANETEAAARQRDLLDERRRDLEAANRALARVRAKLGEERVARARLRDGHLPEGRFTWEPLAALPEAKPGTAFDGRLVRRIHPRPVPLPSRPRHEPDGWMLRGLEQGPVVRVFGPYVVSGGWWHRTIHREYHFAETRTGEMLWVFYDRPRRRWFLQGRIE